MLVLAMAALRTELAPSVPLDCFYQIADSASAPDCLKSSAERLVYFIFFRGILLDNDGSRRGLLSGAWKVALSHALASAVCPFSAANRGGIHVFAARIPEAVRILWRDRRPRPYGRLFLDDVAGVRLRCGAC